MVRATAICVALGAGRIFVFSRYGEATFYRPLGGGIEFGETGLEWVQREMLEEIGVEVVGGRLSAFWKTFSLRAPGVTRRFL